MDFFIKTFYSTLGLISLDNIANLLRTYPFSFGISSAIFFCIILIIQTFSRYKILSFKIFIAWLLSCIITLFCIANANIALDKLYSMVNAQIILSFASSAILLIFCILNMLSNKPRKKKKNYGYNAWWINILSFIILLAFCWVFNIGLFAVSALSYLQ